MSRTCSYTGSAPSRPSVSCSGGRRRPIPKCARWQSNWSTVSDSGRWAGDSSASLRSQRRGRGLTLMSGLADRVDTVRTAGGTRVVLRFDDAAAP
ncbi:ATP-binding protein [Mycobacterium gastri]|uniref:ATP-binding protein n=1 Tax=Mycobacterium gastri TaxID=1777 RepID=UPI003CC50CBB